MQHVYLLVLTHVKGFYINNGKFNCFFFELVHVEHIWLYTATSFFCLITVDGLSLFKTLQTFWFNLCFTTFRNRRSREASILQSIENGAQTLFEVVSKTYSDVDRKLWIPASFNVRLHVDHLNSQHKLPKVRVRNSVSFFFLKKETLYPESRLSPECLNEDIKTYR